MARRGFAPRAEIPLRWFFAKLAAAGYLDASRPRRGSALRGPRPAAARRPGPSPRRARGRSIRAPGRRSRSCGPWSSTCPSSCAAKRPARTSCSRPTRLPLWFDYFSNDNLLYEINNRLGAEAVARELPAGRPATIVEIGGGSGSAALAVGERLARDGGALADRPLRLHRDRADLPAPRRALDPRPLSRPRRRVPEARHERGLRVAGRRARRAPTSSTPSTRSTSPATSRRRSPASARRCGPEASPSSPSACALSRASRSTSSSSSTSSRTSRASRPIRRRARTTVS